MANALTHGIGAVLSIIGTVILVLQAHRLADQAAMISYAIYGGSITFLFSASTLYHSFQKPRTKKIFRILDHIGIYLMIAGTYTPFMAMTLDPSWGRILLWVVWGIAAAGILFKIFFTGRFEWISLGSYLAMGWLSLLAVKPMLAAIPTAGLWLLGLGGLCFSAGVIFYRWRSLFYHHAIWHIFVMAGGIFHYFAVLYYSHPGTAAL